MCDPPIAGPHPATHALQLQGPPQSLWPFWSLFPMLKVPSQSTEVHLNSRSKAKCSRGRGFHNSEPHGHICPSYSCVSARLCVVRHPRDKSPGTCPAKFIESNRRAGKVLQGSVFSLSLCTFTFQLQSIMQVSSLSWLFYLPCLSPASPAGTSQ